MRSVLFVAAVLAVGCKRVRVEPTEPVPTTTLLNIGAPCASSEVCLEGLTCSSSNVCTLDGSFGTALENEACTASIECAATLACASSGVCVTDGAAGTSGIGEACATSAECARGLSCFDDMCEGFPIEPLERPDCPDDDAIGAEDNPFRVLFERPPFAHDDVHRHPYPADALVSEGLDLSGHATFEAASPFGDVAAGILEDAELAFDGFGANPTVYLRLADLPDFGTVRIGLPLPEGADTSQPIGTVGLVDLTEGPSFGTLVSTGFKLRTHQPYLCDPWIALYPASGQVLRSGHTYGAFVTTGLLGGDEAVPVAEPGFQAMLGAEPGDADEAAAWATFAPMRAYVAAEGIDPATLAGGTVFTVEDFAARGKGIRDAVWTADGTDAADVVVCEDAPGPHADPADATRGCFGASPGYHELQGTLQVAHVQEGAAPFVTRADGGGADWSGGRPAVVDFRPVTFSMTVPVGPAPEGGWPVVLFAPDAGENYRTFVAEGLADRWTSIAHDAGTAQMAVISIDTWLTGPRKGEVSPTWLDTFPAGDEEAFLHVNPLHPVAVRDNITQSAVDWFSVVRFLQEVDWSVASPIGEPIPLATDEMWFVGQGIGGRVGPLVAAYEPSVQGLVLAGTGAHWSEGLLETEEPFALNAVLGPALGDPNVDRFQPIVALAQQVIDRTDPVNHARFVQFASAANRDILYVAAPDDPRVGPASQSALARGLFTDQVVQDGAAGLVGVDTLTAPVNNNASGSTAITVVNVATDPHRQIYTSSRAMLQVDQFIASGVLEGRATLPYVP